MNNSWQISQSDQRNPFLLLLVGGYLIYNAVLLSAVQQSESVIYIYM